MFAANTTERVLSFAGKEADGRIAYAPDGKPNLMTDGNGLISLNLAKQIPEVSNGLKVGGDEDDGKAPILTQFRLWAQGETSHLRRGALLLGLPAASIIHPDDVSTDCKHHTSG